MQFTIQTFASAVKCMSQLKYNLTEHTGEAVMLHHVRHCGDLPCSVLVANNGMAAVKFIRSVQDWAYKSFGNEHAIALVAMATPEDMRVDAEHIKMADQFVEVPGGSNANNYANVRLIVQTAEKANVDAVWPGW